MRLRDFTKGTNTVLQAPSRGELQSTLVATKERHMSDPCNLEELHDFDAKLKAGMFRRVLPTVIDVRGLRCSPKSASARSSLLCPVVCRSHTMISALSIEVPLVKRKINGESDEEQWIPTKSMHR